MKKQVIKVLTAAHGKVVVAYWKSVGIDVGFYVGIINEKDRDESIYYGVINGRFDNYFLEQVEEANAEIIEIPHDFLIGKRIRGFECRDFVQAMEKYIGEIGVIERVDRDYICVKFEDEMSFFYNYTEAFDHFIDEEEVEIKDEIPTLGVGVLMMVSVDDRTYKPRFVIGKTKEDYLAWAWAETVEEIKFTITQSWKFAKPILQKAILTKQDISDGKGVGVEPHLIEVV